MSAQDEALLVSRLRATLASLGEGVVTTDTHGVVVELNPEAERLTGWTGTEARGQPLETVFSLLDERTATPLAGLAQTVLRHGAVVGGGDTLLVARDGTRRPVAHNAAPIRDEAGMIRGVALVFSDQTAQQTAQRALRASEERLRLALAAAHQGLREKEALLREVHHRVKNNLQIISSLLRLEAAGIDHSLTRAVLQDMQDRIRSMALLHETLYRSDHLARVPLRPYLERLCAQLFRSLATTSGAVQLHLDVAPVRLDPAQAVPCGLLVNELVSNSLKHAFPRNTPGEVRVELQPLPTGPELRLSVQDTGVGLPATFEPGRLSSLGLQLVTDLTRQLEGTLAIERGPGARFTVTFRPAAEPGAPTEPGQGTVTA